MPGEPDSTTSRYLLSPAPSHILAANQMLPELPQKTQPGPLSTFRNLEAKPRTLRHGPQGQEDESSILSTRRDNRHCEAWGRTVLIRGPGWLWPKSCRVSRWPVSKKQPQADECLCDLSHRHRELPHASPVPLSTQAS